MPLPHPSAPRNSGMVGFSNTAVSSVQDLARRTRITGYSPRIQSRDMAGDIQREIVGQWDLQEGVPCSVQISSTWRGHSAEHATANGSVRIAYGDKEKH